MMEYNGPKRNGKSPLDQGLDFIFSPFTALSGIVNQNAPIKKGGKYRVPQDMMKAAPRRKNPVTASPRRVDASKTGVAYGKNKKQVKTFRGR
jgi:hypothetical protein